MQVLLMILMGLMLLLLTAALGKQKRRITEAEEKIEVILQVFNTIKEGKMPGTTTATVTIPTPEVKEETANV